MMMRMIKVRVSPLSILVNETEDPVLNLDAGSKDVGRRPTLSMQSSHDDKAIEDEPVTAPDIPGGHAANESENGKHKLLRSHKQAVESNSIKIDDMKEETVNPFVTNDDNLPEDDEEVDTLGVDEDE
jgi:hypothetical protein